MEHTLAAVDVLLAVDLLCSIPPVTCPALLCERELRRHAVKVDVLPHPGNPSAPRRVAVVPDGWFQLSVEGAPPLSISLELDRGTEEQKYWRRKVQALAAWAEGPYRQAFQTDNLTIAVVTPTDMRRDQLRGWTSRELAERNLTHLSDIFLFTSADPVTTRPAALFFDPLWHPPGTAAPVPLIEKAPVSAVAAPRPGQRQEAVVLNL